MPHCFLGSSIKFQGHTGWKIDNLNPIWVRLLSRSQLSNPSDLPCYASAFRRRRHYVFGLSVPPSVCPSVHPCVRPKPEITSFHLYMGPLVHPTNRDRFAACPSVCPSVRLSVRPSGEVSGHLPENAWREWSEILHVDVSWAPPELIRLWSWSVDFPPFGVTLT